MKKQRDQAEQIRQLAGILAPAPRCDTLRLLAAGGGALPIEDLADKLGLSFEDYREHVKALAASEIVSLDGGTCRLGERVELTTSETEHRVRIENPDGSSMEISFRVRPRSASP